MMTSFTGYWLPARSSCRRTRGRERVPHLVLLWERRLGFPRHRVGRCRATELIDASGGNRVCFSTISAAASLVRLLRATPLLVLSRRVARRSQRRIVAVPRPAEPLGAARPSTVDALLFGPFASGFALGVILDRNLVRSALDLFEDAPRLRFEARRDKQLRRAHRIGGFLVSPEVDGDALGLESTSHDLCLDP